MRLFQAGKYKLPLGEKAYVMGILNVTPDSFSDGGRFIEPEQAVRHALEMQEQGADIIDIGAQSTRPSGTQISAEEELERLLPVLKLLQNKLTIPISIDTFYPQVALASLENGASMINDVTGFDDLDMISAAAKSDCGCIVMHHFGIHSGSEDIISMMHHTGMNSENEDIISNMNQYFMNKIDIMAHAGIRQERICLDPGIGFGKTHEQNLQILANCGKLSTHGCALLIAASRKRMIGGECGNPPYDRQVAGTVAAHSIAVADGADIIRAHDVAEAVQSTKVASAIRRCRIG